MANDEEPETNTQTKASQRLEQVSNHIKPKTKKKRRAKSQQDELPPDYSDLASQMATMRQIARTPKPSNRGYIRQKAAGKLWVRERLAQLFDKDSFQEVGSISGTTTWRTTGPRTEDVVDFIPNNNLQGFAKLKGRKVICTADDFSVRAGHSDGATSGKTLWTEKMAIELRLPVIKLVDGSSGGGSVTTIRQTGWTYLPHVGMNFRPVMRQLDLGIPNLGAVLGPAIGLGAARVTACHFSVMAADIGALFNAGPEVVKNATFEEDLHFQELGGPGVHCQNGTIDNVAPDEEGCFEQLRTVLGYLPDCGTQVPPYVSPTDSPDRKEVFLRSLVPRKRNRMYNPRKIIEAVVDQGSFFEIGPLWGLTVISGLARLNGYPVGIVSSNCEYNSGATDAQGAQKLLRLIKFCDVFNLPILQFVDVPGYAIGTLAERSATMKWGVELAKAYYSTTTPMFSVVTRRAFGVAAGIMMEARDPMPIVGWPSMNTGSLPLEGGIEVGHRQELREAENQGKSDELFKNLEDEYNRLVNPVRTANAFGIEEIIDPPDTRPVVCAWVERVYEHVMPLRIADRTSGKLKATFS